MQDRVLKVLEFTKVREQLLVHAASTLGQEKINNLVPSRDFAEVVRLQEETDEAATVIRIKGHVPLSGIHDIRPHIKRSVIGGVLSPHELVQIASIIHASRQMKRFIEEIAEERTEIPILLEQVAQIVPLTNLEQDIKQAIDESGEVLGWSKRASAFIEDSASCK